MNRPSNQLISRNVGKTDHVKAALGYAINTVVTILNSCLAVRATRLGTQIFYFLLIDTNKP